MFFIGMLGSCRRWQLCLRSDGSLFRNLDCQKNVPLDGEPIWSTAQFPQNRWQMERSDIVSSSNVLTSTPTITFSNPYQAQTATISQHFRILGHLSSGNVKTWEIHTIGAHPVCINIMVLSVSADTTSAMFPHDHRHYILTLHEVCITMYDYMTFLS